MPRNRPLTEWAITMSAISLVTNAEAHGPISLPWWFEPLIAAYLILPWFLLAGAAFAAFDRSAPAWQRFSAPLSLPTGIGFFLLLTADFKPKEWIRTVLYFAPLVIPSIFVCWWVFGRWQRRNRRSESADMSR